MIYLIIILILTLFSVVSITMLVLEKKEIRLIAKKLKEINSIETNKLILMSSPNKALEELSEEVNIALKKRQKTEVRYKGLDRELRQSISNISHDLRTPLTSIVGYIELLKDDSLTKEEKNEYMDIIKKRAGSLQVLIESFFDLSRLDAREYNFELKGVNLSNILCELIASFYNDFVNNGIEPIIDIDQSIREVQADENAVMRIFSNLVQNVLKHGKNTIEISHKVENDMITTSFTNDAPDLTNEDVDLLFLRSYTADKMRTGQNTGLGLAITKALVEQMGYIVMAKLKDKKLSIIIIWQSKK